MTAAIRNLLWQHHKTIEPLAVALDADAAILLKLVATFQETYQQVLRAVMALAHEKGAGEGDEIDWRANRAELNRELGHERAELRALLDSDLAFDSREEWDEFWRDMADNLDAIKGQWTGGPLRDEIVDGRPYGIGSEGT